MEFNQAYLLTYLKIIDKKIGLLSNVTVEKLNYDVTNNKSAPRRGKNI